MTATETLDIDEIQALLSPYLVQASLETRTLSQIETYLGLLLKWNARTNLTSIRQASQIVIRHFGESVFAAQHIGECKTLLDFGSGAGFPGLPIQLVRPNIRVTLAESQNKKAIFLREVVRTLSLDTEVWMGRVETMPLSLKFDVVTMRAVDRMDVAIKVAAEKTSARLVVLSTAAQLTIPTGFFTESITAIPQTEERQVVVLRRTDLSECSTWNIQNAML